MTTMTIETQRRHAERMQTDPDYCADAMAERRRCGAILNHGLERGQWEQAKALALETDMAAEAACRLLDTMPATATKTQVVVAATDFAEHMARVRGCGRAAPADDPEVTDLLARARIREGQD